MQKIDKIVITGGPCGGKSTAIFKVKAELEKLGYSVLVIAETATELITGGVAPWTLITSGEFQRCQMTLQIQKEKVFEMAAGKIEAEKIVILCDRGKLDNKAYMTEEEYESVLLSVGYCETELRDDYSAVFHMTTAAKGAEKFYTLKNNKARRESREEAIKIDDKLIAAWTGHPHLRIIGSRENFDEKIDNLTKEILSFLGEPEPLEIERKFLIKYPDISILENNPFCKKAEITQAYIMGADGKKLRIRKRGEKGNFLYFETRKEDITPTKRIETERRITKEEYERALKEAGDNIRVITKDRYCLVDKESYWEIDIFPFWNDKALMEIELSCENEQFYFPENIEVIKEVTDDKTYRNYNLTLLAQLFGKE